MENWEIEGRTFIITGGASGLGARYLETFLSFGAKSIAILDIAEGQAQALVERCNKTYPGEAMFVKCDMSIEEDIVKAFEEVVAMFKKVDVIINNAGIMDDSPDVWRHASEVNFQGVVSLTLKGIKHMDKREGCTGGTIVNIASIAAFTTVPTLPMYCGAKCAVMQFCRCIAMDPFYETTGVRIMCICFGPTDTQLMQNLETRVYDPKLGKAFAEAMEAQEVNFQMVGSAIISVKHMMETGINGSFWLSVGDKPVKDITVAVDQAFGLLEKEIYGSIL